MDVVSFTQDGKRRKHGHLDFSDLATVTWEGINLRFALFTGPSANPSIHTLCIDVDKLSLGYTEEFVECIDNLIPWEAYILHTGNGFHVYVPLGESFVKEEIAWLTDSWEKFCDELDEYLNDCIPENINYIVDRNVLSSGRYGRVPGSSNKKKGKDTTKVTYIDTLEGDVLPDIGVLLEHKEPPYQGGELEREQDLEEGEWEDSDLYKYCGFSRYCCDNIDKIPYDWWRTLLLILKERFSSEVVHDVAKRSNRYNKEETETFIKQDKFYRFTCKTIQSKTNKEGVTVCNRCPHNLGGNSPLNVHGALPTPSKDRGFHVITGKSGINYKRIECNDVANYFFNTHKDTFQLGNSFYIYDEDKGIYNLEAVKTNSYGVYSQRLKEILNSIPHRGIYHKDDRQDLATSLYTNLGLVNKISESINPPNLIGFINGVLDIDTGSFHEHDPANYLTNLVETDYIEDINTNEVEDLFFNSLRCDDSVDLVQAFLGLALSNIPNERYQEMLWCAGVSGAGKSTLLRMLGLVTKNAVVHYASTSSFRIKGDGFPVSMVGKKVFAIDDFKPNLGGSASMSKFAAFMNPIISGEPMHIKVPYDPVFSVSPTTTVVVTSNSLPLDMDAEEGLERRLRCVYFSVLPSQKELDFIRDIGVNNDKAQAIVRWGVEGLRKCLQRREDIGYYTPDNTPFEEKLLDGELSPSKPTFDEYFKLHLECQEGVQTLLDSIVNDYTKWCTQRGGEPLDYISIQRALVNYLCNQYYKPYDYFMSHKKGQISIKDVCFRNKKKASMKGS